MVLLVDDEPDIRDLARLILEVDGLSVVEATSGTEALQQYFELAPPPVPAAVVLDQRMPGLSGLEVAEQMLSHNPGQVIVLFSAHLDQEARAEALPWASRRACPSWTHGDSPRSSGACSSPLPEVVRRPRQDSNLRPAD